jgi:hypothetical protein
MDWLISLAQKSAIAVCQRGFNLGDSSERDFFGGFRADVQSDWRVDLIQFIFVEKSSFIAQFLN